LTFRLASHLFTPPLGDYRSQSGKDLEEVEVLEWWKALLGWKGLWDEGWIREGWMWQRLRDGFWEFVDF